MISKLFENDLKTFGEQFEYDFKHIINYIQALKYVCIKIGFSNDFQKQFENRFKTILVVCQNQYEIKLLIDKKMYLKI